MSTIIGKSKNVISLSAHTSGLLKQFESLFPYLTQEQQSYKYLIEPALAYHDLGKVSPAFQIISMKNWKYDPKVPFPSVPHSLFSLFWLKENAFQTFIAIDRKVLLSAIAFHHWRNSFENILGGDEPDFIEAAKRLIAKPELREKLVSNLQCEFENNGMEKYVDHIGFNEDLVEAVSEGSDLFHYLIPPYLDYFLPKRLELDDETNKRKYIFTVGILMRLDHFTSYIQEENSDEPVEKSPPSFIRISDRIIREVSVKFGSDFDYWQNKVIRQCKEDNIMLIAPTGVGKTEFAALWGSDNKFFVTLPLRSAVNAAYERFKTYYDDENSENTGLLHSDADVYLYEKTDHSETENIRVLDMARQLSLPVSVSTGDQIFPCALKYPGYEKIYATLAYSRLVIDEIQAYDPKAAAIIVKLIEDIVNLGGKFLLMTATFPQFIKYEIQKRIGSDKFKEIDRYNGIENIQKHNVILVNKQIDSEDVINEILNTANQGKRVLVIVNTVKKAQSLYSVIQNKISGMNIVLEMLHSKYTLFDRQNKEREIVGTGEHEKIGLFQNPKPEKENIPKILISTQVLEASIDIDADMLFTEIAPIDSLIQRIGRILRRIQTKSGFIYQYEGEPNIKIFFSSEDNKKFHLESGKGSVYENELIVFSILILAQEADPSNSLIDDLLEKYKGKEKKKPNDTEKLKILKEFAEKAAKFQFKPFVIYEHRKKGLVEKLYDQIEKTNNSKYIEKFYSMLTVLDAGYMSDRKKDAHRLFRDIFSAPVIVHDKFDELRQSVIDFCERHHEDEKLLWAAFKKEVLSYYIINVNLWSFDRSASDRAEKVLYNLDFNNKLHKKIKRWLNDIYVIKEGRYDEKLGLIMHKEQFNII